MASASFPHKARTQQTSLGAADMVTSENNHRVSACFVLRTGAAIIVFAPGLDAETTVWDRRRLVATAACDAAPAQTIPQVRLCTHVSVYDAARSVPSPRAHRLCSQGSFIMLHTGSLADGKSRTGSPTPHPPAK